MDPGPDLFQASIGSKVEAKLSAKVVTLTDCLNWHDQSC